MQELRRKSRRSEPAVEGDAVTPEMAEPDPVVAGATEHPGAPRVARVEGDGSGSLDEPGDAEALRPAPRRSPGESSVASRPQPAAKTVTPNTPDSFWRFGGSTRDPWSTETKP